jgi:protein-tyrosine phosphatase
MSAAEVTSRLFWVPWILEYASNFSHHSIASSRAFFSIPNFSSQDDESSYAQVVDRLFIGDRKFAKNKPKLCELGIKYIVNATCAPSDGGLHNFFEADQSFVYLRCAVADSDGADIAQFFERTSAFIAEGMATGYSVLVHCQQGVSRSASLILAYLIRSQAMTLKGAYMHLRQRRPTVKPNANFLRQLIEWEKRSSSSSAAASASSAGVGGGDAANAKKRVRPAVEVTSTVATSDESTTAEGDASAAAMTAAPLSSSLMSPSSASESASAQSSISTGECELAADASVVDDASHAIAPDAKRSKTAAASNISDAPPLPLPAFPSIPPAPRVAGPMRPPPAAV